VNPGNGWYNSNDNAGYAAQIPGCSYLSPWVDPGTAPPSPLCAGGVAAPLAASAAQPTITPPPA
jgi:glucan 1,3-beta-glucosidase